MAKKVISVQNLANVLMQQSSVVKFDFGLRAIKAIIGIAENMKQQVQNIWESELPDIINDRALESVPWKGPQIITEVSRDIDPSPDDYILKQEHDISASPRKGGSGAPSAAGATSAAPNRGLSMISVEGGSEAEQIGYLSSVITETEEGDDDDYVDIKGAAKRYEEQQRSAAIFDLEESEESDEPESLEPSKQDRLDGPFFKKVFKEGSSWQKRQTRVVMKQIGLKGDARMSETDLEERIILKAVKDFNTSKFSRDQLSGIEGIINDIFMGSAPPINLDKNDYSNL